MIQNNYKWEIELSNGSIITKGGKFDSEVIRFSLIPNSIILPRHDVIFADYKFIRRFCRGFTKYGTGLKQYIHCVITDKFRIYFFYSNGQCLIVDKNYELYL